MEQKKVLIVCYSFPPRPGVGGRKWAKFAKYLSRIGWHVSVLMSEPGKKDHSPWSEDVKNIPRVFLKTNYPAILDRAPRSIAEKIWYRICLVWMKWRTRANYYDRAVLLEQSFLSQVSSTLQSLNTNILVVSGGPFSLLYYGALLKERNPGLRFIADIRDDWMSDASAAVGGLSQGRKTEEQRRFQKVLHGADAIIVSGEDIRQKYADLLGDAGNKVALFTHAVDTDSLAERKKESEEKAFHMVYFGSLYPGAEEIIRILAKKIAENEQIYLDIYSGENKYQEIFQEFEVLGTRVHYHKPVLEKEVFSKMAMSDAVLTILPDTLKDVVGTKFIEIVAQRVPIIAIGFPGRASEFVVGKKLGLFLDTNSPANGLQNIETSIRELDYNFDYDYSKFTFQHQVHVLEAILTE